MLCLNNFKKSENHLCCQLQYYLQLVYYLGIGGALSNPNTVQAYPFLDIPWLQGIFKIMSSAGDVVFGNLALIMCIGLSVGLAKKDKGTAALAGAVAFLVMNASIKGMIGAFNPAVESIDTGVVGSIVIGSLVAYLT